MSDVLKAKRKIELLWDNDTMVPEIKFDAKDFPSFEGVLAVLEVAKLIIQNMQRQAMMTQMQNAHMQAMQEAAVQAQLKGKGILARH